MTDEATICGFMEPRPYSRTRSRDSEGGWWRLVGFDRKQGHWEPALFAFTLDRLHEVEARLTEEQWYRYTAALPTEKWWSRELVHATAAQKIAALAKVLRAGAAEA